MRVHPNKPAIRAFGIAESFRRADTRSTIAGAVMRSDLVLDGFAFGGAAVGGDDATDALVRLYRALHRDDVNVILLSGAIISYYNVVDVDAFASKTGVPVICLTYSESPGIEDAIKARFIAWEAKVALCRRLGARTSLLLKTGKMVYVRLASIEEYDARQVMDSFTLQGALAEPVRVARLLARARRADHRGT
ncbi:MAG: DUF99 family protein [Thaumarchaeota archaeon]|nr:DUF99 family protein [Nitrososphaerota archaeon]